MDLSATQQRSINNVKDSELFSLSYSSIDYPAASVVSKGKGSLLVKADINFWSWYTQISTRKVCNGKEQSTLTRYFHLGLCSAPELFLAVADAMQWILYKALAKGYFTWMTLLW